jgi:AbrB family looped-hinge helix DNA binding protein
MKTKIPGLYDNRVSVLHSNEVMLVLPHYEEQIMRTATSKLTTKYQATIPEPVRRLLHLEAGDAIAFDIADKTVQLRKASPVDLIFAQGLEGNLTEWSSPADDEAYRDL